MNTISGQYIRGRIGSAVNHTTVIALDLVSLHEVIIQTRNSTSLSSTEERREQTSQLIFSLPTHKHICQVQRRFLSQNEECLVFKSRGTLTVTKYLRQFGLLDELRVCKFFYEICSALVHLQSYGLTTSRIHADNVIFTPQFEVALFDFEEIPQTRTQKDVFSLETRQLKELGTLILRMLKGSENFSSTDILKFCTQNEDIEEGSNDNISQELKLFLQKLFFEKQEGEYTNIQELLQSYWVLNNSPVFCLLSVPSNALLRDFKSYFSSNIPQRYPLIENQTHHHPFKRLFNMVRGSNREEEVGRFVQRVNSIEKSKSIRT